MLFLSNSDVQQVLDIRECLQALRDGYMDLAKGDAAYIPRIDILAPNGNPEEYYRWGSMTGACVTYGVVASRMKSDVLSWPGGKTNEKYCMQPGTYCGIILVYSIINGEPLALIQDGYLQHMRVGGTAGLGVEALARKDKLTLGMIGSGGMARTYLEAIAEVSTLIGGKVFSPNPEHREAYCREMSGKLGIRLEPVESSSAAIKDADIVVTATDSSVPTFDATHLKPGAHVTTVTRRELSSPLLDRADVIMQLGYNTIMRGSNVPGMEWLGGSIASYVCGQPEERKRLPSGKKTESGKYPLLIDLMKGKHPGRTSPEQITLFINDGTQGLQFASVAGRTLQLARKRGIGKEIPLEWFLQDIRD